MIPAYNSTKLLESTLRSVLEQDPGPDRMQIAVVDDASPSPEAGRIVADVAPGRVEYHRGATNVGLAANWNACIDLSRGRWVHILHQDDLILPGFYERLGRADAARPDLVAAFCRYSWIDGDGRTLRVSDVESDTPGVLEGWAARIAVEQRIQCPSIAVKRATYEQVGGFRPDLRFTLDWEMWARVAFAGPVWYEPEMLACWRQHDAGETGRLARSRSILPEIARGIDAIAALAPEAERPALLREATRRARWWAEIEVGRLMGLGRPIEALRAIMPTYRHEPAGVRLRAGLRYARWAAKVGLVGGGRRPEGPGTVPS